MNHEVNKEVNKEVNEGTEKNRWPVQSNRGIPYVKGLCREDCAKQIMQKKLQHSKNPISYIEYISMSIDDVMVYSSIYATDACKQNT